MSQTGLHSIQFKALCLIVIRAAVRLNAPHWETDIQLPQELLPNPWCTQTIRRACLRSQWSLELAARVCLRWHWALGSASFKKMLRSDLLCSFPLDSVLLGNVHGYARVRTSIYIYIYIPPCISPPGGIKYLTGQSWWPWLVYNRSEGIASRIIFPERDWSGAWLRLDGRRRLAVPKEARFGPPPGRKSWY